MHKMWFVFRPNQILNDQNRNRKCIHHIVLETFGMNCFVVLYAICDATFMPECEREWVERVWERQRSLHNQLNECELGIYNDRSFMSKLTSLNWVSSVLADVSLGETVIVTGNGCCRPEKCLMTFWSNRKKRHRIDLHDRNGKLINLQI